MITIPAALLLVLFGLFGLVFVVMIAANLYHGYRFGRNDPMTMTVNSIFVIAVISVVALTIVFLLPVDWTQSFTVSSGVNVQLPAAVNAGLITQ